MIRLLLSVIPIIVSAAIFYDAKKYKSFWFACAIASACSLVFPIGPLLYVMFRKQYIVQKNGALTFCSRCGYSSPKRMDVCPKCKNQLQL